GDGDFLDLAGFDLGHEFAELDLGILLRDLGDVPDEEEGDQDGQPQHDGLERGRAHFGSGLLRRFYVLRAPVRSRESRPPQDAPPGDNLILRSSPPLAGRAIVPMYGRPRELPGWPRPYPTRN